MEVHRSIGGQYARVSGCPREAVTLWGSPPWSTLAGGICDLCRGVTLEQCVPEGLYPMGETHAAAIYEQLQSMGRTLLEELCGGLSLMGRTPH